MANPGSVDGQPIDVEFHARRTGEHLIWTPEGQIECTDPEHGSLDTDNPLASLRHVKIPDSRVHQNRGEPDEPSQILVVIPDG